MNASKGFKSRTMKSMLGDHVLRNGLSKATYEHDQARKLPVKLLPGPSTVEQNKSVASTVNNKLDISHRFAHGIREQVKGNLSLGAEILQVGGGMEKVFKRIFSVREGERFLKASRCCLSTTAGPIPGLLFISTEKLGFCSNKSVVKFSSPTGELLRFHYKVVVPLTKIKRASQNENAKKKSQKYLQVVTMDDFEFWFMGFVNYKKTFKCLHEAMSQAQTS